MKAQSSATIMLVSALLLSACATLFVGPEQDVQVETEPAGMIRIVNEKTNLEVFEGPSPAVVTLERSERYRVTVTKTGYETATFKLKKELRFWFLCNALCAPLALVDFLNGSTFELEPEAVSISLERVRNAPVLAPPVLAPPTPAAPRPVPPAPPPSPSGAQTPGNGYELVLRARDESGQLRMLAIPMVKARTGTVL
ncbi:MAG TPA: hypothetical protein VIM73_15780 [Polyangiaceae bacterium]